MIRHEAEGQEAHRYVIMGFADNDPFLSRKA
jgi:hypothetical protein